jgi:hypothetical protein
VWVYHTRHSRPDRCRCSARVAQSSLAAGLVTICSADFFYEGQRERACSLIEPNQFIDFDASQFDDPGRAVTSVTEQLVVRGIVPSRR